MGDDGAAVRWCPTAVDAGGKPAAGKGSQCTAACRQADYVSSAAEICGEMQCAAAGSAPSAAVVEIRTDGFDGDAGFYFGASYRLVLFAAADAMHASAALQHRQSARLRGAPARPLCPPGARLAAQGSWALPE